MTPVIPKKQLSWSHVQSTQPRERQSNMLSGSVIKTASSELGSKMGDPSAESSTGIFIEEMQDVKEVMDAYGNVGTLFFSDLLHEMCRRFVIE